MTHYAEIDKLLKSKTKEEKIIFCTQCLNEKERYTDERIFALTEYLKNLGKNNDN